MWTYFAGGAVVALVALIWFFAQSRRAAVSAEKAQPLESVAQDDAASRLVDLALQLSDALNIASLKRALTATLPALIGGDDFWVIGRFKDWAVLVGQGDGPVKILPQQLIAQPGAWECFPLRSAGRTLGLLGVTHSGDDMTDERRRTLATAAALIGGAIRNVRRYKRVRNLNTIDSLTWCFTRRYGSDALSREIQRMRRSQRSLCVAMVDLDNFKLVNDTHGHVAGDKVLATVGRVMRNALRASDIACRSGGEEFLLILPDTTLTGAVRAVENLRRRIGATVVNAGVDESIHIRVSAGVTDVRVTEEDPSAAIRRADLAMYEAKRAGRDQVVVRSESGPPGEPTVM